MNPLNVFPPTHVKTPVPSDFPATPANHSREHIVPPLVITSGAIRKTYVSAMMYVMTKRVLRQRNEICRSPNCSHGYTTHL